MAPTRRTMILRDILVSATVLAVSAVLVLAGVARGAAPQQAVSEEVLEMGRTVYEEQCQSCHGAEGQGDGPAARFLDPRPRDFTSGQWVYTSGDVESLVDLINTGVDDTGMTPFEDLLTAEEMSAVANYVLTTLVQGQEGAARR